MEEVELVSFRLDDSGLFLHLKDGDGLDLRVTLPRDSLYAAAAHHSLVQVADMALADRIGNRTLRGSDPDQ